MDCNPPHPHRFPEYRPDIDGLRAVAIATVVAYHAFPLLVPGGFIGVDIFFVISGYLITSIILNNLKNGTFYFSDFYMRRAKRLFPALLAMLSICYAISWFLLMPEDFRQLGKHMAGGDFYAQWRYGECFLDPRKAKFDHDTMEQCIEKGHKPLVFDSDHISPQGSRFLMKLLARDLFPSTAIKAH